MTTVNDVIQILFMAVAFYFLYVMFFKESFEGVQSETPSQEPVQQEQAPAPEEEQAEPAKQEEVAPAPVAPEQAAAPQQSSTQGPVSLKAEDLLPKYDEANEFAKQNPVSDLLKEQNFLISGYHMGINTVLQSNKLAYHDLRSAPPIPKETVGPFLQSSYESPAGTNRRSLEIL
jgi:hypothetical protein